MKPPHGICELRDYWFQTFSKGSTYDLSLTFLPIDQSLYESSFVDYKGVSETITDDGTASGDETFENKLFDMERMFGMKKKAYSNFELGDKIIKKPNKDILLNNCLSLESLKSYNLMDDSTNFQL